MTNRLRRNDLDHQFGQPLRDEGSSVRDRVPTPPPVSRKSDPNLSLDQRLESKLTEAASLLAKLEPQDARARLLHIAMLRRDESLLTASSPSWQCLREPFATHAETTCAVRSQGESVGTERAESSTLIFDD